MNVTVLHVEDNPSNRMIIRDLLNFQGYKVVEAVDGEEALLAAARERPSKPIIVLSPNQRTIRRMSVVWGVHCVQTEDAVSLEDMVDRACVIAYQEGFARPGDRIAITAGIPLGTPGATNMLRIAFVRQDGAGSS